MYESFYQLTCSPFRLAPDHRFRYSHRSYTKAKGFLRYALQNADGVVVITGGTGSGKTTLADDLRRELDADQVVMGEVLGWDCQAVELLRAVAFAFDLEPKGMDATTILHDIAEFAKEQRRENRQSLVVIDDAHQLSLDALRELSRLASLHVNSRLLVQMLLLGDERLRESGGALEREPLSQRITASFHLEPLEADEVAAYIRHRLSQAGWNGDPAFNAAATARIHQLSRGVPRRINLVCNRLLLNASLEGKHDLGEEDVALAVEGLRREKLTPLTGEADREPTVVIPGWASRVSSIDSTDTENARAAAIKEVPAEPASNVEREGREGVTVTSFSNASHTPLFRDSPTAPTQRTRPLLMFVAGLLAVIGLGGGILMYWNPHAGPIEAARSFWSTASRDSPSSRGSPETVWPQALDQDPGSKDEVPAGQPLAKNEQGKPELALLAKEVRIEEERFSQPLSKREGEAEKERQRIAEARPQIEEQERALEEQRRKAEHQRLQAEEQQRIAQQQLRDADERRIAEERRRRAEDERYKKFEEQRIAFAEQRRIEEQRLSQIEAKRAAEAEQERQQIAEARRQLEEQKRALDEQRGKTEQQLTAQQRQGADEQHISEERALPEDQSGTSVPEASISQISQLLQQEACAALQAFTSDARVEVQGYVSQQSDLGSLRRKLLALPGVSEVIFSVQQVDDAKCGLLDFYAPYWAVNKTLKLGASIRPYKSSAEFLKGEPLVINITSPSYDSHIYVDYYSLDGGVVHMVPSPRLNNHRAPAGYAATIGSLRQWIIAEPFGTDMIVLLAVPEKVFEAQRKEQERWSDYLPELGERLRRMAKEFGNDHITVDFLLINTKPGV